MKPIIPFALLGALLAIGAAEAATTTPVGYETLTINPGFNFVGVRLHEPVLAAGQLESFATSPNRVIDNDTDLAALISSGTYVLEINDGSGIIQEVTTTTGTGLNVAADLSGLTYPVSYTLRKASTLASVFGNTPETVKLDIGAGTASGADQIWTFNGSGYTKLYYDEFGGLDEVAGWYNVDTGAPVDADLFNLIYADGFIISSANGKDVTVVGEVKKGPTELNLVAGFNFAGSVAPVGATLETSFGDTAAEVSASGISIGAGTVSGADQLWFFNGTGYTKVYFDEFGGLDEIEGWYNVETGAPVPASTPLPPGYVVSAATPGDVLSSVPSFYGSL